MGPGIVILFGVATVVHASVTLALIFALLHTQDKLRRLDQKVAEHLAMDNRYEHDGWEYGDYGDQ